MGSFGKNTALLAYRQLIQLSLSLLISSSLYLREQLGVEAFITLQPSMIDGVVIQRMKTRKESQDRWILIRIRTTTFSTSCSIYYFGMCITKWDMYFAILLCAIIIIQISCHYVIKTQVETRSVFHEILDQKYCTKCS